jgi:hypothetical protein
VPAENEHYTPTRAVTNFFWHRKNGQIGIAGGFLGAAGGFSMAAAAPELNSLSFGGAAAENAGSVFGGCFVAGTFVE